MSTSWYMGYDGIEYPIETENKPMDWKSILQAVGTCQNNMPTMPLEPRWYETTDPAPGTPILPEDAPDGVPAIILIELPFLPITVIGIDDKDDDDE